MAVFYVYNFYKFKNTVEILNWLWHYAISVEVLKKYVHNYAVKYGLAFITYYTSPSYPQILRIWKNWLVNYWDVYKYD